jgi:hypothetical protein
MGAPSTVRPDFRSLWSELLTQPVVQDAILQIGWRVRTIHRYADGALFSSIVMLLWTYVP